MRNKENSKNLQRKVLLIRNIHHISLGVGEKLDERPSNEKPISRSIANKHKQN